MATTVEAIKTELESRGFPIPLIEDGFSSIIDRASARFNDYSSVITYGSFLTVQDQQDYKIFDPEDSTLQGFARNATDIKNVYWNPVGDFTDLDMFSPGWSTVTQISQIMIIRQKLGQWLDQYGNQGSEVIGIVGEPASVLRLYPTPQSSGTKVIVEFENSLPLIFLGRTQMRDLMDWVCYYVADSLANIYSTTAGIELLGFTDSTAAMKYWQGKAEWYYSHCMTSQAGIHGEADRT